MQIPKPFTRAVVVFAPVLEVAKDMDHEGLEKKHQEMQKTLEQLRDVAESWYSVTEAERGRERTYWNS
jgi:lysophospholipid acyltransferase (LPLAT)-like uncharacterized protein